MTAATWVAALSLAAAAVFAVLIAAGSLDVLRTVSGQNKIQVFDADAVRVAVGLGDADIQDGTKLGHLAFNIARLLPGTNGDTNTWWTVASSATAIARIRATRWWSTGSTP